MTIKIIPNDTRKPANKLADVELHFDHGGPLAGLKIVGFAIWRTEAAVPKVTMPCREFFVNGDRRYQIQVRPIGDALSQQHLVDVILQAYDSFTAAEHDPYYGHPTPYGR